MFQVLFHKKTYRTITHEEARQRLISGSPLLLDVRTKEEYVAVHIPGSVLLPLNELESKISALAPEKGREIIVYCRSGARAAAACSHLTELGYTDVSTMGGICDWKYATAKGSEK
ncbi:MAG TPA: rhodanese-like domain-containing protein [Clostridiales bacterium]|nr:rhodanese-like domain-containing protein [Clostridiales bacterium]